MRGALGIEPSEKLVLLIYAEHARKGSAAKAWPAIASVAARACMQEKQARRIVHNLVQKEFLLVVQTSRGGAGKTTVYQLNMTRLNPPSEGSDNPPVQGSVNPPVEGRVNGHQTLPFATMNPPLDPPKTPKNPPLQGRGTGTTEPLRENRNARASHRETPSPEPMQQIDFKKIRSNLNPKKHDPKPAPTPAPQPADEPDAETQQRRDAERARQLAELERLRTKPP